MSAAAGRRDPRAVRLGKRRDARQEVVGGGDERLQLLNLGCEALDVVGHE